MRTTCIWKTSAIILFMTTLGVVNSATAELHAVVEDSATLVLKDAEDTVLFRRSLGFAKRILRNPINVCSTDLGHIVVEFDYAPIDSNMINPFPRTCLYFGGRSHLLVISHEGEELFSADVPPHTIDCSGIVSIDPNEIFFLYSNVGELVKVDVVSNQATTLRLSGWGYFPYPEEPYSVSGWLFSVSGDHILAARSGHDERRYEVMLVSPVGGIIWKQEGADMRLRSVIVDDDAGMVIVERLHLSPEPLWVDSVDVQALSQSGEEVWVISLGKRAVEQMTVAEGKLHLKVRWFPVFGTERPDSPDSPMRIDLRSGMVEEAP